MSAGKVGWATRPPLPRFIEKLHRRPLDGLPYIKPSARQGSSRYASAHDGCAGGVGKLANPYLDIELDAPTKACACLLFSAAMRAKAESGAASVCSFCQACIAPR